MQSDSPAEFDSLDIRIAPSARPKYRSTARKAVVYAQKLFDGREAEAYSVEVRLPNDERRWATLPDPPAFRLAVGSKAYGVDLFNWLFPPDSELRQAFRQVRWSAESYTRFGASVSGVRLRVWLDPDTPALQALRWETLRDPDRDEPLSLTMPFSRFTYVADVAEPPSRERSLRVLLVTANPKGLDGFNLPEIDIALEERIVKAATERYRDVMTIERLQPTPSLEAIRNADPGKFQIVHVLAHSIGEGSDACLLLPDAEGRAHKVNAEELVEALVGTHQPPFLVILTTPVTAAQQEGPALLAVAPILIARGVQAVLVVQSPIQAERLRVFSERFFGSLLQNGVLDWAVADARVAIYKAEEWDWTYPVLFLRTLDPRMYVPLPRALSDLLGRIRLSP